ncbi:MAG: sigma-70 family RNA polymerase sigma factor [Planctomycetota bacterium]
MSFDANPETRLSLIFKLSDRRDHDAWSEFVQIYQPVVQRFVQRRGLQHADAAEITQDVLSVVAKSIESWDPEHEKCTFRGWLYRLTRNQTIDFLRRRKPEVVWSDVEDIGPEITSSEATASSEFHAEYEKQLFYWAAEKIRGSFKPANWMAFWKSTVEGDPIERVAEELGMECGAVYVARSRIMSRLSKLIQERMNETSVHPPGD